MPDDVVPVIQKKYAKRPMGLTCLVGFVLVTTIASARYALRGGDVIFFTILLSGKLYKIYYALVVGLGLVIAFGLHQLKRWVFYLFLAEQSFFILLLLVNMIGVSKETLITTGWTETAHLMIIYRATMGAGILFLLGLMFWLSRYKKYFLGKESFKPV